MRIELTETLRQKLGKAYSPSASTMPSHYWPGYGTFGITASLDVRDVPTARAAILDTLSALRTAPIDSDVLQRARQPMLEAFDNGLKTDFGWLTLVDRAQSEPGEIDRYLRGKAWLSAMTAADVEAEARKYLDPVRAVEVLALPQGVPPPPR